MAFLLRNSVASHFRQTTKNDSLSLTRRQLHVEAGAREKALLAADPALRRFNSHKKGVAALKKIGDVLTLVVVAGCCYEIYVKVVTRDEPGAQA